MRKEERREGSKFKEKRKMEKGKGRGDRGDLKRKGERGEEDKGLKERKKGERG